MTQEEKAKRYDEALEIAKKNYVTSQDLHEGSQIGIECFKNTLESIFPELNESEDEKIKKEIIEYIKTGTYHKKWVTWLEKQGEKDKLIHELGEYKVKYIQETLGKALTMNNKDDERVRKTTIAFLKDFADKGYENAVECIDWLEKQGKKEYAFKSFDDEDARKFMQYIEKQAKAYELNLPNRSYDIYAFSKDLLSWIKKQDIFSKKDVDDAYLKGVTDTKNEIEKQYEANYQIRKDIATFIFNYKGDIKDRAKWMNYLGIKVSFVEKQGEKPQGKSALEAIREEKVDNANKVEPKDYSSIDPHFGKPIDKVEPKFKVGDWITIKE